LFTARLSTKACSLPSAPATSSTHIGDDLRASTSRTRPAWPFSDQLVGGCKPSRVRRPRHRAPPAPGFPASLARKPSRSPALADSLSCRRRLVRLAAGLACSPVWRRCGSHRFRGRHTTSHWFFPSVQYCRGCELAQRAVAAGVQAGRARRAWGEHAGRVVLPASCLCGRGVLTGMWTPGDGTRRPRHPLLRVRGQFRKDAAFRRGLPIGQGGRSACFTAAGWKGTRGPWTSR
jgi:hypothetical protein